MRKFLTLIAGGVLLLSMGQSALAATSLQSQINNLLLSLQTTSAPISGCVVPVGPLAFGSYGPEVKKLQVWLNQHGYPVVPAGKESEYFGPLTHFAMLRFQSVSAISPASGFYGLLTMAEIKKRCAQEAAAPAVLQIGLASDSPKGGMVAEDLMRVEILRLQISGKSTLDSLAVRRIGTAQESLFDRLYIFDGDVRLTTGHTFDKQEDSLVFANLGIQVSGTKTLSIMADVSNTEESGEDGVEISSTGSVGFSGVVTGAFPLRSGLFTKGGDSLGTLMVEKDSGPLDAFVGQRAVHVASLRVIPRVTQEALLRSLALTFESSFDPSAVSNFVLKSGSETVAVASAVNARGQILLRFDKPLTLSVSARPVLSLFADFAATIAPSATMQIYLKSPIDFYATIGQGSEGVSVSSAKYNNSARNGTDASWLTIQGGVVTYAFRGPSVATYAANQAEAELMRFDIKAQSAVEVYELRIMLTAGGADASSTLAGGGGLCNGTKANYFDVKLVDASTGAVLTRSLDTKCLTGAEDTMQTLAFVDRWRVAAGQTRTVKVVTDIGTFTPSALETIKATLVAFEREDIRNLDTGAYLGSREVVPAGNLAGAAHRIYASQAAAEAAQSVALIDPDEPETN